MKNNNSGTSRRDVIKTLGLGSAAMVAGGLGNISEAQAVQKEKLSKPPVGLAPIKIKRVKAIGVDLYINVYLVKK